MARAYGIRPGYRLEWRPAPDSDELIVRVVPDRAELGRRLKGSGRSVAPERDGVAAIPRALVAQLLLA